MKANRNSFRLQQVFACVGCFAVAFGVPSMTGYMLRHQKLNDGDVWIPVLTSICAMGAFIGGGIGILFNRFWRGAAWGAIGIVIMCLGLIPFLPIIFS